MFHCEPQLSCECAVISLKISVAIDQQDCGPMAHPLIPSYSIWSNIILVNVLTSWCSQVCVHFPHASIVKKDSLLVVEQLRHAKVHSCFWMLKIYSRRALQLFMTSNICVHILSYIHTLNDFFISLIIIILLYGLVYNIDSNTAAPTLRSRQEWQRRALMNTKNAVITFTFLFLLANL
jgi:hypothetical protein